jgi:hypothetical protein
MERIRKNVGSFFVLLLEWWKKSSRVGRDVGPSFENIWSNEKAGEPGVPEPPALPNLFGRVVVTELSAEKMNDIIRAVRLILAGWDFSSLPQPFTWAPDRHLRACLVKDGRTRDIILRRSWNPRNFEIETFLYRSVLPHFSVCAPVLWAVFELDGGQSQWMVLEDVGVLAVRPDSPEDRQKFLSALGRLHGQGVRWLRERKVSIDPLPRFDGTSLPYAGKFLSVQHWIERLTHALETPFLGMKPWIVSFPPRLSTQLAKQPMTLLHGDTNFSNGIVIKEEVALIDFERACIGPPSLDLSQATEGVDTQDEMKAYHSCYQETSGGDIPFSVVMEWTDLGKGYNSLYWVSYYVERTLAGNPPDSDWRKNIYGPALECLSHLHDRYPDWFEG